MSLFGKITRWVDDRTGLKSAVDDFLLEDVPASSGWHQVFGSVALFLFLVQIFTGVLLAFNYAPTPGEAYYSVRYIVSELTGGSMIRGLHHWGSSMMIVVVMLHMIQTALWGAYKKPREATWLVGVALLCLVLGFGLTGYLLPWDNRAYWGTVVTTQIMGNTPVLGPYLLRLAGAEGGSVGVITFARFFGLHVLVLPLVTLSLVGLHVYLVRRHGATPVAGDAAPKKKFYPEQVFKDTVAIFVAFAILFVMAVAVRVPLDQLADPTNTNYIPRPDWYFLFLFQSLKFFEGSVELVGTHVLPGLAMAFLVLLPFLDRGKMKLVRERAAAIAVVAVAVLGWTGLTVAAILSTPPARDEVQLAQEGVMDTGGGPDGPNAAGRSAGGSGGKETWKDLSPTELAGIAYFREEACFSCHAVGESEAKMGPDLAAASSRSAEWMMKHFKRPDEVVPGAMMPAITLNDKQLAGLVAFIQKLNPENAEALRSAPYFAVRGAKLYQENNCHLCHMVNGEGQQIAPPLNGIGERRSVTWIAQKVRNPKESQPQSMMPPVDLPSDQLALLSDYLAALSPQ